MSFSAAKKEKKLKRVEGECDNRGLSFKRLSENVPVYERERERERVCACECEREGEREKWSVK